MGNGQAPPDRTYVLFAGAAGLLQPLVAVHAIALLADSVVRSVFGGPNTEASRLLVAALARHAPGASEAATSRVLAAWRSRDFPYAKPGPLAAMPGDGLLSSPAWEPVPAKRTWLKSAPALLTSIDPAEFLREFMLRLVALWRRADPARFARAMAQLRAGRLWLDFRPARPPGRLLTSTRHLTRGPSAPRITRPLVVRGEP